MSLFKKSLTSPCWTTVGIWSLRLLSLMPPLESLLLDLNHLARYIVRSGVNNSLLLKGLTSLKFINEFWRKPWVWQYRSCLPPHVLDLHQQLESRIYETTPSHIIQNQLQSLSEPSNSLVNYSKRVYNESVCIWSWQSWYDTSSGKSLPYKSDSYLVGSKPPISISFVFCLTDTGGYRKLPPTLMSLIKDISPHVSLRSFLRSSLLHPWNWGLDWILSPLISFIPILPDSLYCTVLTFSHGRIHGKVVSFF